MPKSRHTRNGKPRPKKKRLNNDGTFRVPPVAIAYYFDNRKKLKFVYPRTGEHPDITIRRSARLNGVTVRPGTIQVTNRYWEIVRSLPASAISISEKEVEQSIFELTPEEKADYERSKQSKQSGSDQDKKE